MSIPSDPETNLYPSGPIWSRSEKSIARRAFDAALERELQELFNRHSEWPAGFSSRRTCGA